jgi:hypothetical protein
MVRETKCPSFSLLTLPFHLDPDLFELGSIPHDAAHSL